MKTKLTIAAALSLATIAPATAQWRPTGEWQCGPYVHILSSTDGFGGADFYVTGAWFNNHYTIQRGQLYYNGIPCVATGDPWGFMTQPRRKVTAQPKGCRIDGDNDPAVADLPICE